MAAAANDYDIIAALRVRAAPVGRPACVTRQTLF